MMLCCIPLLSAPLPFPLLIITVEAVYYLNILLLYGKIVGMYSENFHM